jgi:hypothetical protein
MQVTPDGRDKDLFRSLWLETELSRVIEDPVV